MKTYTLYVNRVLNPVKPKQTCFFPNYGYAEPPLLPPPLSFFMGGGGNPPSSLQFCSHFNERCEMYWIERKINFPIHSIFIFELSWKFIENWGDLSMKMTIIKKKIGKFIFLSIQHILYLSCKFDHFWKKYILMYFFILLNEKKIGKLFMHTHYASEHNAYFRTKYPI